MARKARIDASGAVHHIIVKGIARQKVFDDDSDRVFFIERLELVLSETKTEAKILSAVDWFEVPVGGLP